MCYALCAMRYALYTESVETEIVTAYVSLGSNLGDRAGNLLLAVRGLLEASLTVFRLSAVYETAPVGMGDAQKFLNCVAEIHLTSITSSQLMTRLLRIEYLLGRRNKYRGMPRTADLDVLFYGDQIVNSELITVPHPRMHLRRFALVPMAEIAPHFVHPVLHKTIFELLDEAEDTAAVERWKPFVNG